jgi:hypothetical protein
MGKLIFWAVVIIVGPLWLASIWSGLGIWEKFWLIVILALVASLLIPGLRGVIIPLVVPFVLVVLALLFVYNTFLKWQEAGHDLVVAVQQVMEGGWNSVASIVEKFIPGLGAGTVVDQAIAKQKADAAYHQCLLDAMPDASKAQGAACMGKPTAEREQCLENILSDDSRTPGGIAALQDCRQRKEVFGAGAEYVKPFVDIFCLPFLPEFMQDWVCIDRAKKGDTPAAATVRTDQPYVDCIWGIINNTSSGTVAVPAGDCEQYKNDRPKLVQCAVQKARASTNEWVQRSLPYCEAIPRPK